MSDYSTLSARQRSVPPPDTHIRRAHSRGGWAAGGRARGPLVSGMEDEQARYPGTFFDRRTQRDRGPWYPIDYYVPQGNSWVNWTAAGPPRPELHMRNVTYRPEVGSSQTRAFRDPNNPQRGLHTNPVNGVARTLQRYVSGNPQMRPGRVDRLTNAQYTGQSYSQTTRLQGQRRGGGR